MPFIKEVENKSEFTIGLIAISRHQGLLHHSPKAPIENSLVKKILGYGSSRFNRDMTQFTGLQRLLCVKMEKLF